MWYLQAGFCDLEYSQNLLKLAQACQELSCIAMHRTVASWSTYADLTRQQ